MEKQSIDKNKGSIVSLTSFMKITPTIIVLVIVPIVIIVLIVVLVLKRPTYTPQSVSTTTPATELTPLFENSIQVANQAATSSATITSASFGQGGYIVIHAATADGAPGEVIGYSEYLAPGSYDNVQITLTKPVKIGDNLFAMLHGDDGDQTYGFPDEDLPLKDNAGNIILQKYTVTE